MFGIGSLNMTLRKPLSVEGKSNEIIDVSYVCWGNKAQEAVLFGNLGHNHAKT